MCLSSGDVQTRTRLILGKKADKQPTTNWKNPSKTYRTDKTQNASFDNSWNKWYLQQYNSEIRFHARSYSAAKTTWAKKARVFHIRTPGYISLIYSAVNWTRVPRVYPPWKRPSTGHGHLVRSWRASIGSPAYHEHHVIDHCRHANTIWCTTHARHMRNSPGQLLCDGCRTLRVLSVR